MRRIDLKEPRSIGEDDDDAREIGCGPDSDLDHVEVVDPWGDAQVACVTSEDRDHR